MCYVDSIVLMEKDEKILKDILAEKMKKRIRNQLFSNMRLPSGKRMAGVRFCRASVRIFILLGVLPDINNKKQRDKCLSIHVCILSLRKKEFYGNNNTKSISDGFGSNNEYIPFG